jgi:AraC-like DNA-binding protein
VRVLDIHVDAYRRELVAGSGYVLGEFRCPPEDELWSGLNVIGERRVVAFGESAVRITAAGTSYVSTPNEALIYDPSIEYRRGVVGRDGDKTTFMILDPDLDARMPLGERKIRRPIIRQRRCDAASYALAWTVRNELRHSDPDLLAVDEWALALLDRIVGLPNEGPGPKRRAGPAHWAAVNAVKAMMAEEPDQPWTMGELARAAHYSPYFLSRLFRRLTGSSIASYRSQLRLRESLDAALRPDANLAAVAADHGFSSHSHYTRQFRLAFGRTPSQARRMGLHRQT